MSAAPRTLLSWPWPDEANPYVLRLGEALASRGVAVRPARYLAAHSVIPHGARWLHVHWPEWMTRSPSRTRYRAALAYQCALFDLARLRGVSLAWTAHNLHPHDDPHRDLGERARRALLARCEVVFGHFAAAEADVRALGFRGRFALTPHAHYDGDYAAPFENAAQRVAYRRALGVDDDVTLLVSTGGIEPYKNLPAVAEALVEASPTNVRWIVAGRVGDEATMRALAAVTSKAPWMTVRAGFVAREELAKLVAAADASLLGYRAFYTSGAAVLSLTLGTPVMGPPLHQLAEYVGRPFFAPLASIDAPSMRAALASVRAMGEAARREARAAALANSWDAAARVVDTTLFGGSP
jgi:beta-1,4-mannosyltransferase